eukprot:c29285_g6_i1 orf=356-2155(+)
MNSFTKSFSRQWSKWGRDAQRLRLSEKHLCRPFELPSVLPEWPPGTGFATGSISLGEIEIAQAPTLREIWRTYEGGVDNQGAAFFKPVNIPAGYSCLGYHCQPNNGTFDDWILVARETLPCCMRTVSPLGSAEAVLSGEEDPSGVVHTVINESSLPPLVSPLSYELIWSSAEWIGRANGPAYFWLPCSPDGYMAVGYVVTNTEESPSIDEVKCVRSDLTDTCQKDNLIWRTDTESAFNVWSLKPLVIGTEAKGAPVGSFCCNTSSSGGRYVRNACLKNSHFVLSSMPNLDQLHALIGNYGPTIFFHTDEVYLPSSVYWIFMKGALLYRRGDYNPVKISVDGSNLPGGGTNDGEYWIDLPNDGNADEVKKGDLSSAEVYVHVKPMLGATFTDLAAWIYYPFNGPSTAKLGLLNLHLGKIGQHVSDWEHFTLRVNNFTGQLWGIYFSQHSAGTWVKASELEYIEDNRAVVYSSKNGHSSYAHPGVHLQGDGRIGFGIRNDAARSNYILDSSKSYQIVSAEYLNLDGVGDTLIEPVWLQYMREWGPKVQYNTRAELDKLLEKIPSKLRTTFLSLINKFPNELSGEEGPTGPKEKDNWFGDER